MPDKMELALGLFNNAASDMSHGLRLLEEWHSQVHDNLVDYNTLAWGLSRALGLVKDGQGVAEMHPENLLSMAVARIELAGEVDHGDIKEEGEEEDA